MAWQVLAALAAGLAVVLWWPPRAARLRPRADAGSAGPAVRRLQRVRLAGAGQERRRREVLADLPQACDLLAVCLQSGLPLRRAVEVLAETLPGPLGRRLAEQATKVRLGADEAGAWTELGVAEPGLAELGRELGRAVGSGAALVRTLEGLARAARAEALAAAEVRAKRVGVRSVLPLMVCVLPSFLLLGVVPVIGGVAQHLFR